MAYVYSSPATEQGGMSAPRSNQAAASNLMQGAIITTFKTMEQHFEPHTALRRARLRLKH